MPNVWVVMPSARPAEQVNEILRLWHERGYFVALFRDHCPTDGLHSHLRLHGEYKGYAHAVNTLVQSVMLMDARWIVAAADDIEPDPKHSANEIARQCEEYFKTLAWPKQWHWPADKTLELAKIDGTAYQEPQALWSADLADRFSTFGVMQPTGDRWGADEAWAQRAYPDAPAYIDRICGSAWIGREFIERTYSGKGPFWPGYKHMFCDEELQEVAKKLGVLWQRRDLTHYHRHWGRKRHATTDDCPDFLKSVNTPEHWAEAKAMFQERKENGFPGAV